MAGSVVVIGTEVPDEEDEEEEAGAAEELEVELDDGSVEFADIVEFAGSVEFAEAEGGVEAEVVREGMVRLREVVWTWPELVVAKKTTRRTTGARGRIVAACSNGHRSLQRSRERSMGESSPSEAVCRRVGSRKERRRTPHELAHAAIDMQLLLGTTASAQRPSDPAVQLATTMPTVLSLPYEILQTVCDDPVWDEGEWWSRQRGLVSLSRTCRTFRHPAQAALFRRQYFYNTARIQSKVRFFQQTPHLAAAVRLIDLTASTRRDYTGSAWYEGVIDMLESTPGVSDLAIEFAWEKSNLWQGAKMHPFWTALRQLPLTRLTCNGLAWPELCDGLVGFGPFAMLSLDFYLADVPPDKQSLALQEPIAVTWLELASDGILPATVLSSFKAFRYLGVTTVADEILSGTHCQGAFVGLVGLQLWCSLDARWFQLAPHLRYLGMCVERFSMLGKADLHTMVRVELLGIDEPITDKWHPEDERRMRNLRRLASLGSLRTVFLSQGSPPVPWQTEEVDNRFSRWHPSIKVIWDVVPPSIDTVEALLDGRA